MVEEILSGVSPERLRRGGDHVATLAAALGLPRAVSRDVRAIAACYQPHVAIAPGADRAVARLVAECGGSWDDATAAVICVLVQACDATARLVEGHDPPVATTRRIAPNGDEVIVDLSGAPFGEGRHACPGKDHALALADGVVQFSRLHEGPEPLILPNVWDVASASMFVAAGFSAIGTTSLGVAASHGLADGLGLTHCPTVVLARKLVRLPVPITIDVENGWGEDPADLVAELWELGAAGINIEDGRGDDLAGATDQARIVGEMKRAAPLLFLNARIDTWWLGRERDATVTRARMYEDAGADGVFVPSADEATVAAVVDAVRIPVNVLADRPIMRWRDLGVRRISSGSLPYRCALAAAQSAMNAILRGGEAPGALHYDEVNSLASPMI